MSGFLFSVLYLTSFLPQCPLDLYQFLQAELPVVFQQLIQGAE